MTCIKCAKNIPEESIYCMYCGHKQSAPVKRKPLKRANGTGSISKISGNRRKPWVVKKNDVYIGTFATKTEALKYLENANTKGISDYYSVTFAQAYALWQQEHFRDIAPKTIEAYEIAYKHCEQLYNKRFRNLRTADYQEIIDERLHLSRSSLEKIRNLMSQLSKWAMREEIIDRNFASFIKLPKNEKTEKVIFTDSDIKVLRANDGNDTVKLILILIYTGLRIGELFSLRVSDIHFEDRYMLGGSKTEAGKNRVIPISHKITSYIAHFVANADKLLIDGFPGNKILSNFRRREWVDTLNLLGINNPQKTPHAARHTFASLMVRAEVAPEHLQKIIGHADYNTTANIYIHADTPQLIEAIDKL